MSALDDLNPIAAGASVLQTGLGIFQAIDGNAKMKKYMAQRKAYEIPDEVYKVLNASLNATGGDQQTLNYETNKIGQVGATVIGEAGRLGADPNFLSALFDQQINAIGEAGERNHAKSMEQFSRVLSAYNLIAENKAAKWKSEQDIVKDKIQAAASEKQSGLQNITGGVNTAISAYSSSQESGLYKDRTNAIKVASTIPAFGGNPLSTSEPMDDAQKQAAGWRLDRLTGKWIKP